MHKEKKNIFSSLNNFKDKPAIYIEQGKIKTYAQILKDIKNFTKSFNSKKVIVIFSDNSYEFITCFIAAIKFNQVSILVNPNISKVDFTNLYNRYFPEYVFCRNKNNFLNQYNKVFNFMNFGLFKIKESRNYPINPELSCLLATSGTTGNPKYVKLSRENLLSNTKAISKSLKIKSSDKSITTMPPYYSYALSIINTHLMNGSKIIMNEYSLIDRNFWNLFYKLKPNNLNGVPYTYEILDKIKFEKMNLKHLRYITQAGGKLDEALRTKLIKICKKKGIKFFIMYGQAEASPRISIMPWELLKKFPNSVGIPLSGGKIIVEKKMNSKNKSEGDLIYKGKNVFWGYSNSYKDLSKKNEINNILRTGDIGFVDKKGFIYITGRKKRILKIFGIRISLDQLESELKKNNYDCLCKGNDKKLQIYIKKNDKFDFLKFNETIKNITNLMPKFFEVIQVNNFKRSETGKIKYNF